VYAIDPQKTEKVNGRCKRDEGADIYRDRYKPFHSVICLAVINDIADGGFQPRYVNAVLWNRDVLGIRRKGIVWDEQNSRW
jgi:hypothetical protein